MPRPDPIAALAEPPDPIAALAEPPDPIAALAEPEAPQVDPAVLAQHEEAAKQVLRTKYPKLAQDLDMQQWQSDRHAEEVWRAQQLGQPAPVEPPKPPSAIELLARQPNDPWYEAAANFIPDLVTSAAAPVRQVAQMVGNPQGVKQFDERFQTQELANQMEREKRLNAIPGAETAAGFGEAAIPLAVSAALPPAAPLAFGVGFGLPHTARLMNEGVDPNQALARGITVGGINAAVPGALGFAKPIMAAAPTLVKPLVGAAEGAAVGFANNLADAAAQAPFDLEGAKRTATDLHSPVALAVAGGLVPGAIGAYKGVRDRVQAVRETVKIAEFHRNFPELARAADEQFGKPIPQTGEQMVADLARQWAPYEAADLGVVGDIPGMRRNPEIGNRTPVPMTPEQIAGQNQIAVRSEPGPLTPDTGIMPEPGPIDPLTGVPRMVKPELPPVPEPNMRAVGGELMAGETPASRAQIRDLPPDRVRPDLIPQVRLPEPAPANMRAPGGDVLPAADRSTPAGRARTQQQPETASPEANLRQPGGESLPAADRSTPASRSRYEGPAIEATPEANLRAPGGDLLPDRSTPASRLRMQRQPETIAPEANVRVPGSDILPDRSTPAGRARMEAAPPDAPPTDPRFREPGQAPETRAERYRRGTEATDTPPAPSPEIRTPGETAAQRKQAFVRTMLDKKQGRLAQDVLSLKQAERRGAPEVPSIPEESLFKGLEVQRAETPSPRPVDNPVATPERAPVEAPRPVEPEAAPAPPVEPVKPAPVETTPAPAATVAETPVKPTVKHAEWVRSYRKAEGKNAQRAFRVDQETLDSTAGTKGAEIVHDPMTGEVLVRDGIAPETAGQAAKGLPEAVDLSKHTVEVEGQRVNAHEVVSHLSDTLAGLRRLLDCLKG